MELAIMVLSHIGILGSCVSTDAFRSFYNADYKEHFVIESLQARISFISLMQDSVTYNSEDIKIEPVNPRTKYSMQVVKDDLEKSFFKEIDKVDYLIIDVFFDVYFGIIYSDYGILTNNTWDYPQTALYNNLKKRDILCMRYQSHDYYELWTKYCDKFFSFMMENYPDVKLILNKVKIVDKVLSKDKNFYVEDEFTPIKENLNPKLNILEEYIETNYDVVVIDLTENVYTDEEHIWGKNLVHYNKEFYHLFKEAMLEITGGNTAMYYYDDNGKLAFESDRRKVDKDYMYKLRKYRNSNRKIDNIIRIFKK